MKRPHVVALASIATEVSRRALSDSDLPVYSVTKHRGFVPSLEYFKKQVFSRDTKGYNHVLPGELAYATIHLDEGSLGVCPEPSLISPMYTVFRVDPLRADPAYVARFLKSPTALAIYPRLGKGSIHRRASISFGRLGSIEIPLPPLPEQRRIVATLEKADMLRTRRHEATTKLDQLQRSVFLEMFGDPVTNPKKWPTVALGELAEWSSGGTPSRAKPNFFLGSIPWYSSGELNDTYLHESVECVTEEAIRSSAAKMMVPGTLMIGMYDTAAFKLGITTRQSCCNQAIAHGWIEPSRADTVFVYQALTMGKEHYKRLQRGIRQKNMNLSMIRATRIQRPPLDLQRAFAARFRDFRLLVEKQRKALAVVDRLQGSLQARAFAAD